MLLDKIRKHGRQFLIFTINVLLMVVLVFVLKEADSRSKFGAQTEQSNGDIPVDQTSINDQNSPLADNGAEPVNVDLVASNFNQNQNTNKNSQNRNINSVIANNNKNSNNNNNSNANNNPNGNSNNNASAKKSQPKVDRTTRTS